MGYQKDQSFSGVTHRQRSSGSSNAPPPLPPRESPYSDPPPTYEKAVSENYSRPLDESWTAQDPRSTSSESLIPRDREGRRTLLLIYIHGFMGNETSFQSFPAHIHNLTTSLLADTHVVHTKIYPRYKSRKAIEYARDDFSNWLCPHESPDTDVVILGHSMGGILAAEVALLTPYSQTSRERFRHHILGTVNFDTPFLGMHPGVVISGIGSLFRPAPETPGVKPQPGDMNGNALLPMPRSEGETASAPTESSSNISGYFGSNSDSMLSDPTSPQAPAHNLLSPLASPVNDPNFDPPFPNDVRIPARKGWDSTLHFIMKHSDGLTKATKSYVTSHLEFGGCLADYAGLKARYSKIRALEDVNELRRASNSTIRPPRRVRFVNYYTASTGRIQKIKPSSNHGASSLQGQHDEQDPITHQEMQGMNLSVVSTQSLSRGSDGSTQNHQGNIPERLSSSDESERTASIKHSKDEVATLKQNQEMSHIEPSPFIDDELQDADEPSNDGDESIAQGELTAVDTKDTDATTTLQAEGDQTPTSLLPIPPVPTEPAAFDSSVYKDKDERKLAEKEHSRQMKAFQRAVKDRDKAIKDRRKLVEKREKNARQAREKQVKDEEKLRVKEEKQEMKRKALLNPPVTLSSSETPSAISDTDGQNDKTTKVEKPKRDKKFCMLPPRSSNGERDKCWPRVFMEGVDEVGAHCGLFFSQNPHYEKLVEDAGKRIEFWVQEAASVRAGSGGNHEVI